MRYFPWFYWLVLSMLLASAASAGVGFLRIARPESGFYDKTPGIIATGVPYKVVVYKTSIMPGVGIASGKIPLPVVGVSTYNDRSFKTTDATVDDPSLVEIVGREGNVVTLRGKAPGFTTLRVKARTTLGITQTAQASVGSASPNGMKLEAQCDDPRAKGQTPVLVAADRELSITEELFSDKTPLLSDSFPPIEFGALILVPRKDGRAMWKSEYLGRYSVQIKTPATATTTSLKVPAYGYELPFRVYEPSAISEVRLSAPEKMIIGSWQRQVARIEIVVGGEIPCIRPSISLALTIGPASICSLKENISGKKTDSGDTVYEVPSHYQSLEISAQTVGTCSIKVEARGTGKSASRQIKVGKS